MIRQMLHLNDISRDLGANRFRADFLCYNTCYGCEHFVFNLITTSQLIMNGKMGLIFKKSNHSTVYFEAFRETSQIQMCVLMNYLDISQPVSVKMTFRNTKPGLVEKDLP